MTDYIHTLRSKIGDILIAVPTATALIRNTQGELLLQKRGDNGQWSLPGGLIEPGEEPAEAIIREVKEETGLDVVPVRVTGIYGGASHIVEYPNGDRIAAINISFLCDVSGGTLYADGNETLELRYFPLDALPENIVQRQLMHIEHVLKGTELFFRLPES
ncbi:MAG: NUDIX domain-containing protein [Anaerolineae bacterium]|nr:NUDIX domain-containing protein [Anaerolineae bacterium]